jgi:GDPmannose 4,6-dehydratase
LSAERDWGHAKDYVEAMYLILQQDKPDDYIIATGITTSIRDFIRLAAENIGLTIAYKGKGTEEKGFLMAVDEAKAAQKIGSEYLQAIKEKIDNGHPIVAVDKQYFRPTEVEQLTGDATKARKELGWSPKYDLSSLIDDMMQSDIRLMQKEAYLKKGGFRTLNYFE